MKQVILLLLATLFSSTINAQSIYDDIFKGMESNYLEMSNFTPTHVAEYQKFYNNTLYTIPNATDSYFVESKKSKKRYLKIILDSDLSTEKGKSESKNFTKSSNYLIKKYDRNADEEYYSVHKNGNYFGSITYEINNNKASLKIYAFNGQSFISTLKQLIIEAKTNKFLPYVGKTSDGLASNQRMSLLKGYRDNYAIYSNLQDNWVSHQSFYVNWPTQTLLLSFGSNGSQLKKELGAGYKIISYEQNPKDKSLIVKVSSGEKVIFIQVLEKDNTQIIGVAIR